jgi:hypothetical protein
MDADRCACCDEIIPEGRQICPGCESNVTKVGAIMQSRGATKEEVKKAYEWLYSDIDDLIDMDYETERVEE